MLISVHLPKTAGSSFLAALECHFGERLLEDFADRPLHTSAFRRNFHAVQAYLRNALPRSDLEAVECIHGHFLPLKYVSLQTASSKKYVVWMRDPIERQASHYFYWIRNYNPRRAGQLHRRVVEEEWSLERFCLGPEMRNIYSKFLWGFSLSRFDFIGITEFYETEIEQFSRQIMGVSLENQWKNANPQGVRHVHVDDPELRQKIEAYHHADMMLYQQALRYREKRMNPSGQS
jgi:hypothetical protein